MEVASTGMGMGAVGLSLVSLVCRCDAAARATILGLGSELRWGAEADTEMEK